MTNKQNTRIGSGQQKTILVLAGLLLTFGWALILAATTWLEDLACLLSPHHCSQGESSAVAILFIPIIAGCLMVPIGMIYDLKMERIFKLLITMGLGGILLFFAFWLIAFSRITF